MAQFGFAPSVVIDPDAMQKEIETFKLMFPHLSVLMTLALNDLVSKYEGNEGNKLKDFNKGGR